MIHLFPNSPDEGFGLTQPSLSSTDTKTSQQNQVARLGQLELSMHAPMAVEMLGSGGSGLFGHATFDSCPAHYI